MAYKITDECIACGSCMDECPVEAISEGDIYVIDAATCTDCGSCAEQCPVEAIVQDQLEVLRKGTFQNFLEGAFIVSKPKSRSFIKSIIFF